MCVGALEPRFYEIFLTKLGLSEDEMPQFDQFEENRAKLEKIFKERTQAEWSGIFDGTDGCVTPVLDLKDAALHAHNRERNTFTTLPDNSVVPNPAPHLSRTSGKSRALEKNPEPGEHTTEILTELNFNPEEVSNLISTGAVSQGKQRSML